MLKVGLTGGYASGKSLVARELEKLGCHVIYADSLGHQVLLPGGIAYAPAIERFGRSILNPDSTIDRKKLASIVFANADRLKELTDLVHPAVFRLEDEMCTAFDRTNPRGIVVIEAAILIESGNSQKVQEVVVTSCSLETQIARAIERDHITRDEAIARIGRQLSDSERRAAADYVIDTNGSREAVLQQTQSIFTELRQLAEAS